MNNNFGAKVFAVLGLFGICASIVATGALYLFAGPQVQEEVPINTGSEISIDQLNDLIGNTSSTGEIDQNMESGSLEIITDLEENEESSENAEETSENTESENVSSEVSEDENSENEIDEEPEEAISTGEEVTE